MSYQQLQDLLESEQTWPARYLFKFVVPMIPGVGPLISKVEELLPAFLLALAMGVVVTLATPPSDEVRPAG